MERGGQTKEKGREDECCGGAPRMETRQQHLRYKYDCDGKSDGETGGGGVWK